MEIEKKFVVKKGFKISQGLEFSHILQKYLQINEDSELRLRYEERYDKNDEIIEEKYLITIKKGEGDTREEIEMSIDESAFDYFWELNKSNSIHKVRTFIPYKDKIIEYDKFIFEDEIPDLAEIEFDSKEEMENFKFPDWFEKETEIKNKDIFKYMNRFRGSVNGTNEEWIKEFKKSL